MLQGNLGVLSGKLGGGVLTEVDYKGEINNILDFQSDDARIEKLIAGNKEHLAAAIQYLDGYPNLVVDLIDRINKIRKLRGYAPLTESDTNPWYDIEKKIAGWTATGKALSSLSSADKKYDFNVPGKTVNAKFVLFEVVSNQGDSAVDVAKYLLETWPGLVNEQNNKQRTALQVAKYNNHTQLVALLSSKGGVQQHVPQPQPMGLAPIPHNQPYTVFYWDKGTQRSKPFNCTSWLNANKSPRDMVYDDSGNPLWNPATSPIRFYFPVNPNIKKPQTPDYYGNYFSNYSNHPVIIDGESFPTTEHYFQAQKVKCAATGNYLTDYAKILGDADPDEAKRVARNYNTVAANKGWHKIKRNIMKKAIDAKVDQHSDVKQELLGTGDALLLEYTVLYNDTEWGIGEDGTGENLLGIFLMEKRTNLKKAGK